MTEKHKIEELKQRTNIVDVIDRRVPLTKKGSEHVGVCPFHDDHKESLQVNEKKQVFKCFACGAGGDSIAFLTELGIPFNEAIEEINGGPLSDKVSVEKKQLTKKQNVPEWTYIPNPPQETPVFNHFKFGNPNKTWSYKNEDGLVVSYVCRFDFEDGEKQVLPLSYATDGNRSKWRWMGIPNNRPLYNLDLIKKHPKAAIIVVEGEKTAEAAQKELNPEKSIVTTWIGGANGLKKTNFKPLHNRNIILFPDNDRAGVLAMINLNELIKEKSNVRWMVQNTPDKPHKWDCADQKWKPGELRLYITQNKMDVPPLPEPEKKQPEKKQPEKIIAAPKNPPLPPRPPKQYAQNEHFRFLGYLKDDKDSIVHYFYSFRAKMVIRITSSGFTASNLQQIAPLNYWEDNFQKKSPGFDVKAAEAYLVGNSFKFETYDEKMIRGRGAWLDSDGNGGQKLVIHSGKQILSEGKKYNLNEFKSNHCYELASPLGFGEGTPLPKEKSILVNDILLKLNWERDANAILLAGWCVLAPFSGALKWRSNIWLTGPAGSGKSWTMSNVVRKLMGETGIAVVGKTTEAGIRQVLNKDALPILFDESDIDDQRDADRIQNIVALARASSTSDSGVILHGSQGGGAKTYNIRSMFAFSSIGVHLSKKADLSRFTVLGFKPNNLDLSDEFKSLSNRWDDLVTTEFVHDLQARTLKLMPVIIENIKIIKEIAAHEIGGQRIGDQVATMLAGAWSLESDDIISHEKAKKFVTTWDWTEEKGIETNNDEIQLFVTIISTKLRVETDFSPVERSIGELILIASENLQSIKITPKNAIDILRRNGILVKNERVYFANSAPEIKNMIKNTSWKNNHCKVLERLKGAKKENSRQFTPGVSSRSISLPLNVLIDENEAIVNQKKYTSASNENFENARNEDDEMPF